MIEKISNAEIEVMKILWEAGSEMTVKEIRKILSDKTDWEVSTIKTLLYRLCDKGVIKAEKRGVFYYIPVVSEQEYNDYTTQNMIDRLYGGSAKNLVASLISRNKLTGSDIEELRAILEKDTKF